MSRSRIAAASYPSRTLSGTMLVNGGYREGFVSEFEEPITPLVQPLGLAIQNCEKLHSESGVPEKEP